MPIRRAGLRFQGGSPAFPENAFNLQVLFKDSLPVHGAVPTHLNPLMKPAGQAGWSAGLAVPDDDTLNPCNTISH